MAKKIEGLILDHGGWIEFDQGPDEPGPWRPATLVIHEGKPERVYLGRSTAAAGFAEPSRPPSRRNPIAITPIEAWAVVDPSGKIRLDCICDTKSSALFDMRWEFAWGRRNVGQVTNASCYKKGWSVARVCISAIGVEANSPQPKARTSSGKPGPKASPKTKSRK